ncbi:primosomal protein N' [Luteimicrobium subarcticum]|uniref:Probable replication restart protein PriA n=1 Tax=Luteimicrobium subarcticum TaxID=620910 RepID=A0A2M8W3W9_9MICO|nr:primosomal protein N' [Luteimicrobium subarcticum]PJI85599.1 replication restart DNA helicase PriA [Luteimicrobium subarcticum]
MTTQDEQLTLPGLDAVGASRAPSRRRAEGGAALAEHLPVARVVLDLQPAHLDQVFDYLVPATMDADAQPGVRIKARFGAQEVGGYLVERVAETDYAGRLVPLRRVVSSEQVLTPDVLRLARAVADRYAGTLADVLRLAVPPRHQAVERRERPAPSDGPDEPGAEPDASANANAWAAYRGGGALLGHVAAGRGVRAAWTALPGADPLVASGTHWSAALGDLVRAAHDGGQGVLVVLPDARDVARLARALDARGLRAWTPAHGGDVAQLLADDGPSARYGQFLAVLRGEARVAIGTRAAAFAPVHDLGLAVCWDDGDEAHRDQRAPYPHTREVLALRSELAGCAFVVGSTSRTTTTQALVRRGFARDVSADRATVRAAAPRVSALTSEALAREGAAAAARLPGAAFRAVREALEDGPVLVQVPRRGYVPVVACSRCRTPARCTECHGPLALVAGREDPRCGWCGRLATGWSCDECGGRALRAVSVGTDRTAEELGRAFPLAAVRVSNAGRGIVDVVPGRPVLVVATPGAEPVAEGGYGCALLLDAEASTRHEGLGVEQGALARWLAAAALVRPAAQGGRVLLVGDAAPTPTDALVRWDPAGFADRELDVIGELGLPPAVRMASVTGDRAAVTAVVSRVTLATGDAVLGPVELDDEGDGTLAPSLARTVRVLVRVAWDQGPELARELAASLAVRSARNESGSVRVQVDPQEIA